MRRSVRSQGNRACPQCPACASGLESKCQQSAQLTGAGDDRFGELPGGDASRSAECDQSRWRQAPLSRIANRPQHREWNPGLGSGDRDGTTLHVDRNRACVLVQPTFFVRAIHRVVQTKTEVPGRPTQPRAQRLIGPPGSAIGLHGIRDHDGAWPQLRIQPAGQAETDDARCPRVDQPAGDFGRAVRGASANRHLPSGKPCDRRFRRETDEEYRITRGHAADPFAFRQPRGTAEGCRGQTPWRTREVARIRGFHA
jgi:hypothetical protein